MLARTEEAFDRFGVGRPCEQKPLTEIALLALKPFQLSLFFDPFAEPRNKDFYGHRLLLLETRCIYHRDAKSAEFLIF